MTPELSCANCKVRPNSTGRLSLPLQMARAQASWKETTLSAIDLFVPIIAPGTGWDLGTTTPLEIGFGRSPAGIKSGNDFKNK